MTRVPTYPVHAEHCQWTVLYREALPSHWGLLSAFLSSQTVGVTTSKLGKHFTIMFQKIPQGPLGDNRVNRTRGITLSVQLDRSSKHLYN